MPPAAGAVIDTVGAVRSGVTGAPTTAAAAPVGVVHEIVHGAAVFSAPRLAPSSWNCTPTTPTLSAAVAVTETVPDTVVPAVGAVIDTVGGVRSVVIGGTGTPTAAVRRRTYSKLHL